MSNNNNNNNNQNKFNINAKEWKPTFSMAPAVVMQKGQGNNNATTSAAVPPPFEFASSNTATTSTTTTEPKKELPKPKGGVIEFGSSAPKPKGGVVELSSSSSSTAAAAGQQPKLKGGVIEFGSSAPKPKSGVVEISSSKSATPASSKKQETPSIDTSATTPTSPKQIDNKKASNDVVLSPKSDKKSIASTATAAAPLSPKSSTKTDEAPLSPKQKVAVKPALLSPKASSSKKTDDIVEDNDGDDDYEMIEKEEVTEGSSSAAAAAASASEDNATESNKDAVIETEEESESLIAKKNAELGDGDQREHLNVVFIGHVDAGKSTLSGSVLFEMGTVDKRTIEKFQKEAKENNRESWFLAYIMDVNEEERAKGKTQEVGKAHFETEKKRYTILDAPGHKNYVPAMISGASQADVAVLVISARKGEFEAGFEKLGQTREHAMLAFTLGVRKLVVVINKMDDPSVEWDLTRYEEIKGKLTPFIRNCGFKVKKDVYFLPLAALQGVNVRYKIDHNKIKNAAWAKECNDGLSLIETLDSLDFAHRDPNAPLRIPILYSYYEQGIYNIMGKVETGVLKVGMKLRINPTRAMCRIDSIAIADEVEVRSAKPGENVLLKAKGLQEGDVQKGFVLSPEKGEPLQVTIFTGTVKILELLEHRPLFTAGYSCVIHMHTLVEDCEVEKILWGHDPETKKPIRKAKSFAKSGEFVTCRFKVSQKIAAEPFKDNPVTGRFTLRDEGKTVAIGKLMKVDSADGIAAVPAAKSATHTGAAAAAAAASTSEE